VQLLERTTRVVSLTDAGRALQRGGPAALAGLEQIWEAAQRAGRGEAGRLRVAYSASAGFETAPRLVQAVRDRYPDLEITAEMLATTADVVRAVLDGRVQAGVARMPAAAEGVRMRTVRLERQGVLVAVDHPLAAAAELDLAAIVEHPILIHPRAANPAHHDFVVDLFHRAGLTPRLVHPPVAFDPSQRVIRDGRAIGLVGVSSATGVAAGLCWVPLADRSARLAVQLVLGAGELSPAADRFERVAVATAAAEGWATEPGRTRWIPTTAYLLLGAERPILVDASFRDAAGFTAASGVPARRAPEQELEAQLARHGLEPGDVGYVLHTHLHHDHTGLDARLPEATILVQRRELQYAAAPQFPVAFYDRTDIAALIGPLWPRVEVLDGEQQLFDGVRLAHTGGHTPGHQMVYVDSPQGPRDHHR